MNAQMPTPNPNYNLAAPVKKPNKRATDQALLERSVED